MPKKMGLGRGLDALLPEIEEQENVVREIAIADIDRNPQQPRRDFDEEALKSLSESIRASGVLTPLLVVQTGARYRLVAGERRLRASLMAGLQTVPCVVRDFSRQQEMEATLVENLQREDLNPVEEAEGIRALMEQCGYTQEKAAERLGKSRPAVANLMRLLSLPKDVRAMVSAGTLSPGHARALLPLAEDALIAQFAVFCKRNNQNVLRAGLQQIAHFAKVNALAVDDAQANQVHPVVLAFGQCGKVGARNEEARAFERQRRIAVAHALHAGNQVVATRFAHLRDVERLRAAACQQRVPAAT